MIIHVRMFGWAAVVTALCSTSWGQVGKDEFLWLEEVEGEKALSWVREQNAESVKELVEADQFGELQKRLLAILDSDEKIPRAWKHGDLYYNFWKDADHPRGLWRRTTLEEYRKDEPDWETIIDLDALATEEGENWIWHGATVLDPDGDICMVGLSRGGADADVKREFDLNTKEFVKGGFILPEAKGIVEWQGRDMLYVATDFGPGSLTSSGYPRVVKEWKRGTPLEDATIVYEGQESDVAIFASHDPTPGFKRDFVRRFINTRKQEHYLRTKNGMVRIDVPDDAETHVHREWLFVEPHTSWRTGRRNYPAGALLATGFEDFMNGSRVFHVLFEPSERKTLVDYTTTKNALILNELDNLTARLFVLTPLSNEALRWQRTPLATVPDHVTAYTSAVDTIDSDDFFLEMEGYLTPPTFALGRINGAPAEVVKSSPAFFDSEGLMVSQHFARSADGTSIPYFQVSRQDLPLDGTAKTLLYGYGGFTLKQLPEYNPLVGAAWLERGGVYAVANIRGGSEFGPAWHQAALKANRHKSYEDFAAVAEDLIRRKITSPKHLGIIGRSNGGLLVGNMLTRWPELVGAVVCQVPLLDMQRYHKLLTGAAWLAEYGNPDLPEEWEFIRTFSPYHNVTADKSYPRTLFMTSTRDDRVHPGHARKMVAKMKSHGHNVLYYEHIEGGHRGAANNEQGAFMSALTYTFLWKELE